MTQEERDNLISLSIESHLETVRRETGITINQDLQNMMVNEYKGIIKYEMTQFRERIINTLRKPSKLNKVFEVVADVFKIDVKDVLKKSNARDYSTPRHLTRWLMNKGYAGVIMTVEQISELTVPNGGVINHTHVLYSSKVIKNLIDTDKEFKAKVDKCIALIESE
jgi:chromosomal replication initiation ATPase DnaA